MLLSSGVRKRKKKQKTTTETLKTKLANTRLSFTHRYNFFLYILNPLFPGRENNICLTTSIPPLLRSLLFVQTYGDMFPII